MNNGRDCVHGRQVGKCDTCNLIDAEQRILELEAQVEQLRAAGNALRKPWDLSKILGAETRMLVQQWDVVAAATPAQCLAEVNAHAGRDGFIAGYFHCRNEGFQFEDELENSADAYANQIRQQAKRE